VSLATLIVAGLATACEAGAAPPTPPIVPGSSNAPREVNLIARDYSFVPDVIDLAPGETITLHVINAGLVIHEAVLGNQTVQDAWEAAEAETAGAPPGPTPIVSVPADVAGVRVVVNSGELKDVAWTVPSGEGAAAWFVGCHIPGHLRKGMQIPIQWVVP
jgi:uncharacterized cupredoxin-like copper-binding protein